MPQRIKVLQLQNYYNVSASDLAEQITKSLPVDKYEVTTAFLRGRPEAGDMLSCAENVFYFGYSKKATSGLRFKLLYDLYRLCKKEKYDVVIAHRFKPVNMLMILNRMLSIRVCIGISHGFGEYDRFFRRFMANRLISSNWKFLGVSQAVESYLLELDSGFDKKNTTYINNAIDIEKAVSIQHTKERSRELLGLSETDFIFGSIGRLVPVKGHIYLVRAFREVCDQYPNSKLAIIGEGRARHDLEQEITRLNLQGNVYLLGSKEDALQYAKAFDVFVMPSLSEGLPLALLEAMSAALPVAGSNIPSMLPILKDCEGFSFPKEDERELAKVLLAMHSLTRSELAAYGEKSYQCLLKNYSIKDFRSKYLNLVEEALSGDE